MFVQLFASPEQCFIRLERWRELLEQSTYRVSPGTAVCLEKYCFNSLLGALLGSKTNPFIAAAFQGMPGQGKIPLGLAQPILVVLPPWWPILGREAVQGGDGPWLNQPPCLR